MTPVIFDKNGLPVPPKKVSFDSRGLPVPPQKKSEVEPSTKELKTGGEVGTLEAQLPKDKRLTYNDLENLFVSVNEADKKLSALQAGKKFGPSAAAIPQRDIDIATKDLSQAQRRKEETLIDYQKELSAPVKRLLDTKEYELFFDGEVFDRGKAREYFNKVTQKYGGGSYLVDSWTSALEKEGRFKKDQPRFEKLFDEEIKKEKIDFNKYGKQVFERLAKNQYDNVELIKKDANEQASAAEVQVKHEVKTSAESFNNYVKDLNAQLLAGKINPDQAASMYDEALKNLNNGVRTINDNYLGLVRNINTRVNKKYGRIEQELKRIGETISQADILKEMPESDRVKIKNATERAAAKLSAEKNDIKEAALRAMTATGLPGSTEWATNLSNSILSGFNSGLANLGDFLHMSGADGKVTEFLRGRSYQAEQYAPPKYEWNKNEWLNRAITSTGTSLGASAPALLPTIGIGLATGGAGFAPILATGVTSFAIENAQNAGQQYQEKLLETGDPNAAAQSANKLFRDNTIALPFYFLGGLGDMTLLSAKSAGIKKYLTGIGLEEVEEIPTEYIQSFNEAKAGGYRKSFIEFVKENPKIAYDTAISQGGQGATLGSIGDAMSKFSKNVPESRSQFFANMLQKKGPEFANAVLEKYYTKGVISKEEYEAQKAEIEGLQQKLGKLEDVGVSGEEAILMTSLDNQAKELQAKIDGEQDAAVRAVLQKQLSEVNSSISELATGDLQFIVFIMPGGQGDTRVMTIKDFQALSENEANELLKNSDGISVRSDDDALIEDLEERTRKLKIPENAPEGAYPNKTGEVEVKSVGEEVASPEAAPQVPIAPEIGSLRYVELSMRRPDKNEVIFVPIDALLQKHAKDQPSYDIQKPENRIKGRVEKAKEFIKNYIKDQRAINPKTGERMKTKVSFEPSVLDIDENGKISFEDGRHRVLAAKELGLTEVPIEVPKEKVKAVEDLLVGEVAPKAAPEGIQTEVNRLPEAIEAKAAEVTGEVPVTETEVTPQLPSTQLKPTEYAIQISPATQVSIQPEIGISEKVDGREPAAGPKEVAEKGKVEGKTAAEKIAEAKIKKATVTQKEISRREKKYAAPEGRQTEVNRLVNEVYKFNQQKRGRLGLKTIESLKKRSDLLLEAQRLGIEAKPRTDGSIKMKAKAVDKSNSNMALDGKFVPLDKRGDKLKKLFNSINGLVERFGYDFQFFMPNVIIGADGRKMSTKQITQAVQDLNNGIPSKGANALLNSLEDMAENGIVEVRVGQEVTGAPIDEYMKELERLGERDNLDSLLSQEADTLPEADLVRWVEEMAEEQSFETEIYEPDTEEITAEGGEEPTPKREGEKPITGATRGPVPPSRGGPPTTEGGEDIKRVSGIKKALVSERILAEVDLEEIGDKELLKKGGEIIASGEVEPKLVIDKIIEDKAGVLTPIEVVALITYKAELDTKIEDLTEEIVKREATGQDLGTLQVELKNLEVERDNFEIAAVITAHQQSLSFRLRRYMLDRDFNINVAIAKYKRVNGGVIPADVLQFFQEADKQTKEINKKLKEEEAKVYEEQGERAADNIVTDVKRETKEKDAKNGYTEKAKDIADKFRKLKKKPFKFTDENGNEIDVQKMGISVWDAAIEAGAKAIEVSGQIADGISLVIEKIKDTDFYKNLSKKDRDRFKVSLEDYYTKEIENTPEAKKLKALQKQLDNILAGNVRQGNPVSFTEESPEVQALREKIFEAKKNLGLVRSKMKKPGDVKEYKPSIDENGQLSIPSQYIRDLVGVRGITTIEGMTDAALKDLEPLVPGLTKRQVRDAITKYGQKVNPTLDQVRTDINKAKRVGALISEIEDLRSMTPAEFAVKYRKPKPSKSNLADTEKELKRQINSLKRDLDLDGRINDAIKRAEESLEEYQRKIDELDFSARQQGLPETPELKAAREARDVKRKEYEALKKSDPATKLATAKKAARKAIAELQERIQTKNFSKEPKKKGPIDAELYILNAQKEALKEKAAALQKKLEREKRGLKGVLADAIKELANIPRTLVAGLFDLGATFSQGVRMVYTSPVISAKAFVQSVIQGFSSRKHDQWIASIRSRPEYNLIKTSKLAISDPGHILSEEEGIIIAKYANFIWNTLARAITFGHRPSAKFIQELSPIKFSQRAFDGYMNYIRVSTFLKDSKALLQDGYTLDSNPEVFKTMAEQVNTLTGRASMGRLEGSINWLSTILFAPKKLVSELKLYTPYAFLYYSKMPAPVRKRALLELGTFAMSFLATSALLKAALDANRGEDEEEDEQFWDIDSPNFLTFKIGNQRVSFAGAIKTTLVFMGRLFGDRYVDQYGRESKFGERVGKRVNTKFDLIARFFAGKASPSIGLLRDLADRNPNIDNDDEIYKNVVMPMWLQDVNELKKDNPAEMQALFALLGFIGANVRTVDVDRMQKNISFKEKVKGNEITRNVKLTDEQLQEFQELYETELSRQTSRITPQINLAEDQKERTKIVDMARTKAKKLAQEKLEKRYLTEFRDFPQREKEEPSKLIEKAKKKLE